MPWPAPDTYHEAVQNPNACFVDPVLQAGQVATTRLGLPRVISGQFASVYELQVGGQRWAVRCFLHPVTDQRDRYAQVSQHLSGLWLPSLVDFAYQEQGIRVQGQHYPIVKMEWIAGQSLSAYVEDHLSDPKALRTLAAQWRGVVNSLRGSHMAHGDLQHGNILVTPQGQIKLVDYDAMFVPSLQGKTSPEIGHRNYQHPQRSASDYDAHLDNFSALVIYLSLRALAVEPGLWATFTSGENLIFSAPDFQAPAQSPLFALLQRSPDPDVAALTSVLFTACKSDITQTPELDIAINNILAGGQPVTPQKATPSPPPPSLPIIWGPPAPAPVIKKPTPSSTAAAPPSTPPATMQPPLLPPIWPGTFVPTKSPPAPTRAPAFRFPRVPEISRRRLLIGLGAGFLGYYGLGFLRTRMHLPILSSMSLLPLNAKKGDTWKNPKDGATLLYIPAGEFLMGDRGIQDNPRRTVTLDGYWIYKTPVTVTQYRQFCTETGRAMPPAPTYGWKDDLPMVNVTWDDATAYAQWAGVKLPTDAQWEKAARGTNGQRYPWGNRWDASKCANSFSTRRQSPAPVGSYPQDASPYGVLDMEGNVSQWCEDIYDQMPDWHVVRGGHWGDDFNVFFFTSFRNKAMSNYRNDYYGFRCVAEQ